MKTTNHTNNNNNNNKNTHTHTTTTTTTVTTATTKNVLLTGQLEQVAAIVPTYATGTFGVQYLGGC